MYLCIWIHISICLSNFIKPCLTKPLILSNFTIYYMRSTLAEFVLHMKNLFSWYGYAAFIYAVVQITIQLNNFLPFPTLSCILTIAHGQASLTVTAILCLWIWPPCYIRWTIISYMLSWLAHFNYRKALRCHSLGTGTSFLSRLKNFSLHIIHPLLTQITSLWAESHRFCYS